MTRPERQSVVAVFLVVGSLAASLGGGLMKAGAGTVFCTAAGVAGGIASVSLSIDASATRGLGLRQRFVAPLLIGFCGGILCVPIALFFPMFGAVASLLD